MPSHYQSETIDHWVSDFCLSDEMAEFSGETADFAGEILRRFLTAACAVRDLDPGEIDEPDIRAALIGAVARLQIPEPVRADAPDLCAAFLTHLEGQGRLSGGRVLGAFVRALRSSFTEAAGGKQKPHINPGSKIGRNDPCPCGSGQKYKKCCMGK